MNLADHGFHIAQHLLRLGQSTPPEKLTDLIRACGFQQGPAGLERVGGGAIRDADCTRYLETVQKRIGEGPFRFARINFILAGCKVAKPQ